MTRLVVLTSSYPRGAGESFLGPELATLADRLDLIVVPVWPRGAPPGPDREPVAQRSIVKHPLAPSVLAAAVLEAIARPLRAWRSFRILRQARGNVLVRNLVGAPRALWLARMIRRNGVDHVHASWATVPASVAMLACEAANIPWSMTAHRGDVLTPNLLEAKLRRAVATRCVSDATLQMIERSLSRPLSPDDRCCVVHLGVSLGGPPPLDRALAHPPRAFCAAALVERKRHEDLLCAVRLVRDRGVDLHLDLAGSGPLEGELRQRVAAAGLDGVVRFLGQLSHADVLGRYRGGGLGLVVLSSESEGIPVSLIEAMAAGVPVVATDAGGTRELLAGGAGRLVPVGDVSALADAMAGILADSESWREQAARARRRAEREFDVQTCVDRLLEALKLSEGV